MTREEIIAMARKAGFEQVMRHKDGGATVLPSVLFERFAALVAAHEREECAKVCENLFAGNPVPDIGGAYAANCAAAIRARSKTC